MFWSRVSEEMEEMLSFVRHSLLSRIEECNITSPTCERKTRPDGGKLMQCGRCKTVVYVRASLACYLWG